MFGLSVMQRAILLHVSILLAFTEPVYAKKGKLLLSSEKKLIKHLLDTYEASGIIGRPVNNTDDAIQVQFSMCLIQILDLDEQNQILTVSTWNRYLWHDYLLAWNPLDYGGIDSVRVPAHSIWKPDIVLYNYADHRLKEHREALVTVSSDGSVYWIPQAIYKSSCSIDITNFPFDSQTCHFKFGSWTYDGTKLDILFLNNYSPIDLSDFVHSNEWDIVVHEGIRNVRVYPCCPEPYPDLTYTLVLKRKVAFYSYILVLPCILLSLLVMVLFWIPPDSPAKMQLGINVFVAFFLLLLLLANNTPSGASSIPLIGAYYCANMILITCSTFLAMFIVRIFVRFDRKNKAPRWLAKVVLDYMATVLLMRSYVPKRKGKAARQMTISLYQSVPIEAFERNIKPPKNTSGGYGDDGGAVKPDDCRGISEEEINVARTSSPIPIYRMIQKDVGEIRSILQAMVDKQAGKDAAAGVVSEWKAIALVLDRLFFIAYVATVVTTLVLVFPNTL